jgi:hypothetical protein
MLFSRNAIPAKKIGKKHHNMLTNQRTKKYWPVIGGTGTMYLGVCWAVVVVVEGAGVLSGSGSGSGSGNGKF